MENSFCMSHKDVARFLNVDVHNGLTSTQAALAQKRYGKNELLKESRTSVWNLVVNQFRTKLILILLVSASVSFTLAVIDTQVTWSAFVNPIVILLILLLNAIVDVSQERGSENTTVTLSTYSCSKVKVLRNGELTRLKSWEVVPGDIIDLNMGDSAPADCRLFEIFSHDFFVDQSILTGERESVSKSTGTIRDKTALKQNHANIVFSGTHVTAGHARAIVVLTGRRTAMGNHYQ